MSPIPTDDRRPGLTPPRFRLRTLLWFVALACVLLTVMTALDTYGVFATILLVLAIGAHWMGAAIGHRLRENGDHPLPPKTAADAIRRPLAANEFAPATTLSQRRGPSRWVLILTIAWAVLGGIAGAILLIVLNGQRAKVTNVAAGAIAFAVLGAIWGFALAAFLLEILGAWRQAEK